eukprot:GHVT01007841.1.p1 GENE.GHVT01007841.1~~GHVT01007841.1.p1  ORF type:complete len:137 (-),score=28.24 GHVT01007841.1:138-548(-)
MGCPASPSSPPDSSFAFSTPVSSFPSTPGDLPLASAPPLLQRVQVLYTPTIPHCSQATLIGLMIRVKLYRCIASKYKVVVNIAKGSHNTEAAVNKQLNDKERVAAALENPSLHAVINHGIVHSDFVENFAHALLTS